MLKWIAAIAPPIALLLVGVLLLEPPALIPRERVPTLRLLTGPAAERSRERDIVLAPEPAPEAPPEPDETEVDNELSAEQESSPDEESPASAVVVR